MLQYRLSSCGEWGLFSNWQCIGFSAVACCRHRLWVFEVSVEAAHAGSGVVVPVGPGMEACSCGAAA